MVLTMQQQSVPCPCIILLLPNIYSTLQSGCRSIPILQNFGHVVIELRLRAQGIDGLHFLCCLVPGDVIAYFLPFWKGLLVCCNH